MDLAESTKVSFGVIASLIALASYVPYFTDTFRGKTKPHAFSWLIWALLTGIAYFGQVSDGAAAGSWVTGITAVVCLSIFLLALKYGEKNITRSDWVCLISSLAAIPLWLITSTPLWSVILITLIDVVAFIPTFRKAYHKPHEETLITFLVAGVKFIPGILALGNYSLITVLYPAYLVIMNGIFVLMLVVRRRRVS